MYLLDVGMNIMSIGGIIVAGESYGQGSSREHAALCPMYLGVRAVIAKSIERIHRANLVGMGVLPLQFVGSDSIQSLGITGNETFTIEGVDTHMKPQQDMRFDVPVVGLETVRSMIDSQARVLAVESHKSIILKRDRLVKEAEDAGIRVVGISDTATA